MKRIISLFVTLSICTMTACSQDTPIVGTSIQLRIGTNTFIASLYDTPTAHAFVGLLPLKVEMYELNGNEKYHYLSIDLPANAAHIGTIHAGDIMLYGDNCLVLFYDTFTTSYRYTPIGHIDDVSGLRETVGSDSIEVDFVGVSTGKSVVEKGKTDNGVWYDIFGREVVSPIAGIYLHNGKKILCLP